MDLPYTLLHSKSVYFVDSLFIPDHKPDLVAIVDIVVLADVTQYHFFDTPYALSFEGQRLTGLKLVSELTFNIRISYMSTPPDQTIYSIHYQHLKSVPLDLPAQVHNTATSYFFEYEQLTLNTLMTSAYSTILGCRCLQLYTSLCVEASLP